jgi:hypothetical protein
VRNIFGFFVLRAFAHEADAVDEKHGLYAVLVERFEHFRRGIHARSVVERQQKFIRGWLWCWRLGWFRGRRRCWLGVGRRFGFARMGIGRRGR